MSREPLEVLVYDLDASNIQGLLPFVSDLDHWGLKLVEVGGLGLV